MTRRITIALRAARELISGELESLTDNYWNGGPNARKRGEGGLSSEGRDQTLPWLTVLRKLDAALADGETAGEIEDTPVATRRKP